MSFTITTDVFCDFCGSWMLGEVSGRVDKSKAWKRATDKGWIKNQGKHCCPKCINKTSSKKTK